MPPPWLTHELHLRVQLQLGIQAARVPLPMALDLSRQLSLQLVVTLFPWQGHPLAQPVPWCSDTVYRHFPINISQEMVKAMASGHPSLVFTQKVLLTAGLSGWAVPTELLSSSLRMWGLGG